MDGQVLKEDWEYCRNILPKVSRTFALNIEQLDGEIYRTVLIGYLLFRIADTFEDNNYRDEKDKIADLKDLSLLFEGDKDLSERLRLYEPLKSLWKENSHEKELIENGHKILKCYFDIPDKYIKIIDPLIAEAIEGMIKFKKLKLKSKNNIFQLNDTRELEEYCYYVAGIVGVMLTNIFCEKEGIKNNKTELEKYQIHFGLALQLVNIIKDYKKDIERGWCYIPLTITQKHKINPDNIGNLTIGQQQGIIRDISRPAVTYLDSTLKYIKLLPMEERSIRMFCIIPFVLAYRTLVKIIRMEGNKLSREEVVYLMDRCNTFAGSNNLLEEDYLRLKEDYFESEG